VLTAISSSLSFGQGVRSGGASESSASVASQSVELVATRVPFTSRNIASTPPPTSEAVAEPVWTPDLIPPLNSPPEIEETFGATVSRITSLNLRLCT
jgi:hypothetical protein